MKKNWLCIVIFLFSLNSFGQMLPYQNPQLRSEERATDLVSRLTSREKAALMCDISEAIPRLGIKKFNWWSEALHGYANNTDVTVFPEPIGMAASFDDELVYHIFNAVSDEARAKYNESQKNGVENKRFLSLSVWTPNINIFRDPRWGADRNIRRRSVFDVAYGNFRRQGITRPGRFPLQKIINMRKTLCYSFRTGIVPSYHQPERRESTRFKRNVFAGIQSACSGSRCSRSDVRVSTNRRRTVLRQQPPAAKNSSRGLGI